MVVISALAAWWVTWPRRSVEHFVRLMADDPDKAEAMSGQSGMWAVLRKYEHGRPYFEARPRSLADTLYGKQAFTIVLPTDRPMEDGVMEFTGTLFVERGKLRGPIEL